MTYEMEVYVSHNESEAQFKPPWYVAVTVLPFPSWGAARSGETFAEAWENAFGATIRSMEEHYVPV
jgi:hypothetical protein